jgi:NAD-dependent dihydropyrimidine dehydrogenase PreA subunit
MTDREVYQEFIEWLGETWWRLTDSEARLPMIASYLTPEEAAFLCGFPRNMLDAGKTLEELAEAKQIDPDELEPKLRQLCVKGVLNNKHEGDTVRYALNDSFFIFLRAIYWPGEANQTAREAAPHVNKYFLDGWFDQWKDVHISGLRSLPIGETIGGSKEILPFEDVSKVVDNFEYYAVSECPCKTRHNMDPAYKDSSKPTEVCLHFDGLGRYIVENGMGREITKEETLEILKKAADAGLVHGITNWTDKPDTICSCCPDYCMWFEAYHKLGHGKSLDPSNYLVKTAPDKCKACALCVKRCPMDAIQLKVHPEAKNKFRKAISVDPDACIGCGVCVHKCPTQSIVLEPREETTTPPKDAGEFIGIYMGDRLAAMEAEKQE